MTSNNSISDSTFLTMRQAALISGISIVLMAVFAGYSFGYVLETLVVQGDPATTAENIKSAPAMFRGGIYGWLVIFICDLFAAWGLYLFFKQVDKSLSWWTGFLRFAYAGFLGVAIYKLYGVIGLIGQNVVDGNEVMNFIDGFNNVWTMGLIVFGFHLVGVGILSYRAEFMHKIWGVLLIIAGVGYIFVSTLDQFLPQLDIATLEMVLSVPMTIGELGLAIWLLIKGGK